MVLKFEIYQYRTCFMIIADNYNNIHRHHAHYMKTAIYSSQHKIAYYQVEKYRCYRIIY